VSRDVPTLIGPAARLNIALGNKSNLLIPYPVPCSLQLPISRAPSSLVTELTIGSPPNITSDAKSRSQVSQRCLLSLFFSVPIAHIRFTSTLKYSLFQGPSRKRQELSHTMVAILTTLALSLLTALSSAQSTSVTSFFLIDTDPQSLVASVVRPSTP